MANTKWTMNETQKSFLNSLKNGAKTLEQINATRETEIKTGSINTLKTKGYVETAEMDFPAVETLVITYPDGTEISKTKEKTVVRMAYSLTDKARAELGLGEEA